MTTSESPVVMLRVSTGPEEAGVAEHAGIRDLVRQGEHRAAIREAALVYGPHLHRFFARWTPGDAEDDVQDTLLKAYEALRRGQFDGLGSFVGWLFTIAANLRRQRYRKSRRRGELLAEDRASAAEQAHGELDPGPLERLQREQKRARVREALEDLGRRDQDLLALRYAAGLSWAAVGEVLGISPDAAKVRGSRARKRLLQAWEKRWPEEER